MRSIALIAALAVLPPARSRAAEAQAAPGAWTMPPAMERLLVEGIDSIYRMEFDKAEEAARKAAEIEPEHPHPYMGLAGVAWTRYVYGADQSDPRLLVPFEATTIKTIEVAEKWLKKHPADAHALMALGSAYGLASRLAIIRKQWIGGYLKGRKAVNITKAAVKADPQLWDAYLGLGMYDYYSDLYPHFIGALAKMVLRGNRKRGIETLQTVAEKGTFSQSNAKILLVEIYTEDPFGAKDPPRAVQLMKELRAKYPHSAMVHSADIVALFVADRLEQAHGEAERYLALVREGKYNAVELAKALVMIGCTHWASGRHDEALAAFREASEHRYLGRYSRWAVFSRIKAGNLLDSLGRREEALALYKSAVAEPDTWDFRALAKGYLSKPYAHRLPDRIPPP